MATQRDPDSVHLSDPAHNSEVSLQLSLVLVEFEGYRVGCLHGGRGVVEGGYSGRLAGGTLTKKRGSAKVIGGNGAVTWFCGFSSVLKILVSRGSGIHFTEVRRLV